MNQSKKITIIAVLAILFSLVSLGVSYSSLNTTNIENGVATIQEKYSEVKIEGLKNIESSDKALFLLEPEVNSNKINFGVSLSEQNSNCKYSFNVINSGNIASMVKEIKINGLENYKDNVEVIVEGINVGDVINTRVDPIMVNVSVIYNNPITVGTGGYYDEYWNYQETFEVQSIDIENLELEIIFE
ncbi:MAG: hypothetical protein ACI4WW_04730 [Candidatus Coprovivens sp.]